MTQGGKTGIGCLFRAIREIRKGALGTGFEGVRNGGYPGKCGIWRGFPAEPFPTATGTHSLFSRRAMEASDDISRFHRLPEGPHDRRLIGHLVANRKGRRDDYPIVAIWNSLLAGLAADGKAIPA